MDDSSLTELSPNYKIPAVIAIAGIVLWFLKFWLIGAILIVFSLFLTIQAATLRLIFTPTELVIYRLSAQIREFPYKNWQNWQIYWTAFPILFYFKEINSIHFLPIIFDATALKAQLEKHCVQKTKS